MQPCFGLGQCGLVWSEASVDMSGQQPLSGPHDTSMEVSTCRHGRSRFASKVAPLNINTWCGEQNNSYLRTHNTRVPSPRSRLDTWMYMHSAMDKY